MSIQETSSGVECPSCGRYTGPYEICQHCQASIETRVSLRVVKWVAVGGAILGLLLLWVGVRVRDIPTVQIGEIDLQYNLAIVRLEGSVMEANLDTEKNSFRITIDDGTGKASLNGYGKLAMFREVLGDDFPQTGDVISAIGNLNISESWGVTMFMSSPRRIELLERPDIKSLTLGELTVAMTGTTGWLTAEILEIEAFAKDRSMILKDDTGQASLTVFNTELQGCSEEVINAMTQTGTTIRFLARVDNYRNQVQLRLISPDTPENLTVKTP